MRQVFENSDVGATIVGEADGEADAAVLIDRHGARLAVLDFQRPVEDGLQTVAVLRSRFPDLRIVVSSFNREGPTRERALAQGADAYLLKPVSARQVVAAANTLPRSAPPRVLVRTPVAGGDRDADRMGFTMSDDGIVGTSQDETIRTEPSNGS